MDISLKRVRLKVMLQSNKNIIIYILVLEFDITRVCYLCVCFPKPQLIPLLYRLLVRFYH